MNFLSPLSVLIHRWNPPSKSWRTTIWKRKAGERCSERRTCPSCPQNRINFFWQGSNFHRSPAKLLYRCLCTTNFSSYSRKLLWEELNPAGLVQMLSKQQNNGNWKNNPVKNAMKTTCSLKNCVSTIAINLLMVNLNKTTHTSKFF